MYKHSRFDSHTIHTIVFVHQESSDFLCVFYLALCLIFGKNNNVEKANEEMSTVFV